MPEYLPWETLRPATKSRAAIYGRVYYSVSKDLPEGVCQLVWRIQAQKVMGCWVWLLFDSEGKEVAREPLNLRTRKSVSNEDVTIKRRASDGMWKYLTKHLIATNEALVAFGRSLKDVSVSKVR